MGTLRPQRSRIPGRASHATRGTPSSQTHCVTGPPARPRPLICTGDSSRSEPPPGCRRGRSLTCVRSAHCPRMPCRRCRFESPRYPVKDWPAPLTFLRLRPPHLGWGRWLGYGHIWLRASPFGRRACSSLHHSGSLRRLTGAAPRRTASERQTTAEPGAVMDPQEGCRTRPYSLPVDLAGKETWIVDRRSAQGPWQDLIR
jgi:hypothetical protein